MNRRQSIAQALESWFEREQRALPWRDSYDAYHVWVSEVMAQQTRMSVVVPYWTRFIERFPSLEALGSADEECVTALWSGLGYYRRARMLHEGARQVLERFDGEIPSDPRILSSIRGVGPYTAGAIASIAFDRPAPAVDGNVLRVLSRLDEMTEPNGSRALKKRCWSVGAGLVRHSSSPRALNQALMELGALICKPAHPDCPRCPLRKHCRAAASGRQSDIPQPRARRRVIDLVVPVYLVSDTDGRILLIRKSSGASSHDIFTLPGRELGIAIAVELPGMRPLRRLGYVRHSITHHRIRFEVWRASWEADLDRVDREIRWIEPGDLESIPHPSWVRKAIELGQS